MKKTVFISTFVSLLLTSGSIGSPTIAFQPKNISANNSNLIAQNNGVRLNNSNGESQDNQTKIIFLLALVATGALFWYLFQSRQSSQPVLQQKLDSNTALIDRVSPKLRRELLRLINDPKTVNRLLMGIYKNNSDRSPNWLAEKAIYDLKRGR